MIGYGWQWQWIMTQILEDLKCYVWGKLKTGKKQYRLDCGEMEGFQYSSSVENNELIKDVCDGVRMCWVWMAVTRKLTPIALFASFLIGSLLNKEKNKTDMLDRRKNKQKNTKKSLKPHIK